MKKYKTKAGSTVEISGKYNGIITIDWDWFEENACIESHPTWEEDTESIVAHCECCPDSPFVCKAYPVLEGIKESEEE